MASAVRWLHIYLSLVSFVVVLFFSVTGVTLNHPDMLGGRLRQSERRGQLPMDWLKEAEPRKLEIVELLRGKYGVRGLVDDFRIDEGECTVSFKGPGYAAEVIVSRADGAFTLTTATEGTLAVMNDLHKGRYTGGVWSWVIDLSAIFLTLVSLTGIGLFCYLKRLRVPGLITLVVGGAIVLALIWLTLK